MTFFVKSLYAELFVTFFSYKKERKKKREQFVILRGWFCFFFDGFKVVEDKITLSLKVDVQSSVFIC